MTTGNDFYWWGHRGRQEKQTGWPDDLELGAPLRDRIAPNVLFDVDANPYLVNLFYLEYGHRQPGFEQDVTFVRQVKAQYLKTWRTRFKKLYESMDIVGNPFITDGWVSHTRQKQDETQRHYEDLHDRRDFSSRTGTQRYQATHEQGYNNKQGFKSGRQKGIAQSQNEGRSAQKATTQQNQTGTNIFSDTPQVTNPAAQVMGNLKGGETPVLWNNGMTTTAGVDTDAMNATNMGNGHTANVAASTFDNNQTSLNGESGDTYQKANMSGGGLADTSTQSSHDLNTFKNSGRMGESSQIYSRKGFTGVQVSDMLAKWRATFIEIDAEWLDQFNHLFLQVY